VASFIIGAEALPANDERWCRQYDPEHRFRQIAPRRQPGDALHHKFEIGLEARRSRCALGRLAATLVSFRLACVQYAGAWLNFR